MKRITATELKRNTYDVIARVRFTPESIIITRYGKDYVQIVPLAKGDKK